MTKKQDLTRLHQISQVLLDARQSHLMNAARARQHSMDQLSGLEEPPAPQGALPEVAAQLASLNYQRWADARRAEINLTLARQTAEWIEARNAARLAFGRCQALNTLQARLPK
jgi:hypothetical protein